MGLHILTAARGALFAAALAAALPSTGQQVWTRPGTGQPGAWTSGEAVPANCTETQIPVRGESGWTCGAASAAGLEEAPAEGGPYARQNGAWVGAATAAHGALATSAIQEEADPVASAAIEDLDAAAVGADPAGTGASAAASAVAAHIEAEDPHPDYTTAAQAAAAAPVQGVADTATVDLSLSSGTLSAGVLSVPESAVTAHQGALTLGASQVSSGTLDVARMPAMWTYSAQTPASGTIAGASRTWYRVSLASATDDPVVTAPTCSAGDRMAVEITATSATYELALTAASGATLGGVAAGTPWSHLWQVGEQVGLHCVAANTWLVERDGRIPSRGAIQRHTGALTLPATPQEWIAVDATRTYTTLAPSAGGLEVAGTPRTVVVRRDGLYWVIQQVSVAALPDGSWSQSAVATLAGALLTVTLAPRHGALATQTVSDSSLVRLARGAEYQQLVRANTGSLSVSVSVPAGAFFALQEIIP